MNRKLVIVGSVFVLFTCLLFGVTAVVLNQSVRTYAAEHNIELSAVPSSVRAKLLNQPFSKERTLIGSDEEEPPIEEKIGTEEVDSPPEEIVAAVVEYPEKGECNADVIEGWEDQNSGEMTIELGDYDFVVVSSDPGCFNGECYNYGVSLVSEVDLTITEVGWNPQNEHYNVAACLYEGDTPLFVLADLQNQEAKPILIQVDDQGDYIEWDEVELVEESEYDAETALDFAIENKEAVCDRRLNSDLENPDAEDLSFEEPPMGWSYKGSADESTFNGTFFLGGLTFVSKDAVEVEGLPWLDANERWGMHICMVYSTGIRSELLEIQTRELKPNPVLFYNDTHEVVEDYSPENLQ